MFKKLLVIIFLFYFFALLQSSFLSHFSLFGAVPNLVFILFFLLVFFEEGNNYQIIIWSAIAGIFLDLFSYTYLGLSVVLLIIFGFLLKKVQSLLKDTEDKYPFVYFLPLFIISLLAYNFLLRTEIIFSVVYSSVIASVFFYIYRIIFVKK
ncbi:MAG: rod shape-determining protein MreD [Candidatus Staskawiczbacteria bacterium]|nr:rod shape-determining protein MreD [Candidatus Staskawiczbacteria bacterium]